MNLHYMYQRLSSLVVFRELLQDPVIAAFQRMLASAELDDGDAFAEAVGGDTMDDQEAADILEVDLDTVTGAAYV